MKRALFPLCILALMLAMENGAAGQACPDQRCDPAFMAECRADGGQIENPDSPSCVCMYGTPIIVDTGDGIALTSPAEGVMFDLRSTGTPQRVSWTQLGSHGGFLVLDRNGDGTINDALELFGNFTPQPPSSAPNGFLALAAYDSPENGGNADGIISRSDSIFPRLMIWVDSNHNGFSEPAELHTLAALEIHSISLLYRESERRDQFGNLFRFRSQVSGPGVWAVDVFLQVSDFSPASRGGIGHQVDSAHLQNWRPVEFHVSLDSNHKPILTLTNRYSSAITAFIMRVEPGGPRSNSIGYAESYFDSYINMGRQAPIPQGASRIISVPFIVGTDVSKLDPRVEAVVFSDGLTWGATPKARMLLNMRFRIHSDVRTVNQVIHRAIEQGRSRSKLVADLSSLALQQHQSDTPDEIEEFFVAGLVVNTVATNLAQARGGDFTPPLLEYEQISRWLARWQHHLETGFTAPAGSDTGGNPLHDNRSLTKGWKLQHAKYAPPLPPPAMLQSSCTVSERSVVISGPNNCGTQVWNLRALASDGMLLDEGSSFGTAFGQCTGNYTDCSGTYYEPGNTGNAGIRLAAASIDYPAGVKFGWYVDNWQQATYDACSCDDPNPLGVIETPPFHAVLLTTYWIYYCQ